MLSLPSLVTTQYINPSSHLLFPVVSPLESFRFLTPDLSLALPPGLDLYILLFKLFDYS